MTNHEDVLRLAAASIDFGLSPSERATLEAHLDTCPVCRQQANHLRMQAVDLRNRSRAIPSVRLRQRIEMNIAGPRPRRAPVTFRSLALGGAAMVALVVGLAAGLPTLVGHLGAGATPQPTTRASGGVGDIRAFVGLADPATARFDANHHCSVVAASDCAGDAALADGSIWLTSKDGILRFDLATSAIVARITVGTSPHRIWFAAGSVWTSVQNPGAVVRIDPTTNTVTATIPVGGSPVGIVDTAGSIWIADQTLDRILRLDPSTNAVIATIPLAIHPWGITAAGGMLWVGDSRANVLLRIDPASNTVAETIDVSAGLLGDSTEPADIVAGLGRIWVTGHDGVGVYDPLSGRLDRFGTQTGPRILVGRDAIWAVGSWNALIQRFDPTTLKLVDQSNLYANDSATATGFEMAIELAGDGTLWIATDDGNRLLRVTPAP